MHHALFISEVCREICGLTDQSSLPALARTCRALQEPALDELWKNLYSIHPFLHLLTRSSCEDAESSQTAVQRPTPPQWDTLRKYSERTRSLYMCIIDDPPTTSSDYISALFNQPNSPSFFPNLRALAWYPANHEEMLPFLRFLCGPSLTHLSAEFTNDPANLAMLASLGALCPNIADISISAANATIIAEMTDALSASICQWNDLKQVSCDDLTLPALEHLGRTRGLESLTAYASDHMSSFSHPDGVRGTPFPRLQRLHLYAVQLSNATYCFKGMHLALKQFRLDVFDANEIISTSSFLQNFFAELVDHCSQYTLAELDFCIIHSELPSSATVTTLRDISPLLSFRNLRAVRFEGLTTLSLDDSDITELASTWPRIEELSLSTYANYAVASLPTFLSLIHLIQTCPRLRALSLVVDTMGVTESLCHALRHGVHSDVLHELCLGNSPINSPTVVAHVLRTLYPSLKLVDLSVWNKEPLTHLPTRAPCEGRWGMVNSKLQTLRAVTQQKKRSYHTITSEPPSIRICAYSPGCRTTTSLLLGFLYRW
ncbi:hypothetical protein PAXRUDRAFT_829168 [Paxillus rubicundulus Ve08.2h10]|uniref:F-box domain-containing protein n=1 Tax=Paxillus rubicundulus Ve08.2h10 TaxID=930991 RepID=A0A0D0DN56_9AGAM|nr:hypothetical protein PAXRUDRAFT_829168 [Paxillus rubicundulus Ve08.2h10]